MNVLHTVADSQQQVSILLISGILGQPLCRGGRRCPPSTIGEFADALLFLQRGVLSSSCVAAAYDGNIVSAPAALRRCNKRGDFLLKPDKQAAVQDCRGQRRQKESLSAIAFFLCTRYNKQKTQEELL